MKIQAVAQAGKSYAFQRSDATDDKVLLVFYPGHVSPGLVSFETAKKSGYWGEVQSEPPAFAKRLAYAHYPTEEKTMESKDVYGGMPGLRPRVQHDPMVQRAKRGRVRRRAVELVRNVPLSFPAQYKGEMDDEMEFKDMVRTPEGARKYGQPINTVIVRDIDPVPKNPKMGQSIYKSLTYAGKSEYGPKFAKIQATDGKVYHVGQHDDGTFVAFDDDGHYLVDEATSRAHALRLLDKKTTGQLSKEPAKRGEGRTLKKRATDTSKPTTTTPATPTAKKPAAAKKTTAKKTTRRKRSGPSLTSIYSTSGGDRTPDEKRGVERSVELETTKPDVSMPIPSPQKHTRRNDPALYQFDKDGNPIQTEQMKIDAHLAAGGPQSSIDRAHNAGKPFTLGPRMENEFLWFPKDPNGEVLYSYRPAMQAVDENGDPVFTTDKDGNKVPVISHYGKRAYVLRPDVSEKFADHKWDVVDAMAFNIYKLDAALKKDYPKTTHRGNVAGAVLLMRVLGIRPNSEDEEAQEKAKATRSHVARARREKAGNTGYIYGATSLQAQHVTINGDEAILEFVGKDHIVNTHVTEDPDVVAMLKAHMKGKKGDDRLFPNVTDTGTNEYIKEHMGEAVTNRKLRNFVATSIAADVIASMPKPTTWDAYQTAKAQVCATVCMTLNNKASQARDSYISPAVWEMWEKGLTKP